MDERYGMIISRGKQWAFVASRARRVTRLFDTRAEAIRYGRARAKRDGMRLSVHGPDGMPVSEYWPPGVSRGK